LDRLRIRIATRQSALALWQAEHVALCLRKLPTIEQVELVPMSTRGDEILDRSLQKIGGKGLFIKELEIAMQDGRADLAVHSMKDVPADLPQGFVIAAMLERANSADALVGRSGVRLEALDPGALIGSSSLRRQAQLKRLRPDLRIEALRGNINTRLAKLANGDFDAIMLAAAGLERLGLAGHISQQFTADEILPAAAQGVLGVECLAERVELRELLAPLNHTKTEQTTLAERAIARRFGANCQSPVAAHASLSGSELTITALVALPDGSEVLRDALCGEARHAEALGLKLAERMLGKGARDLLDRAESMLESAEYA
jgi:hydroxymethylbilane synthase